MKPARLLTAAVVLVWLGITQPASAYYSPVHGRWLNRDPLGERGGVALAGFVQNRPTTDVDPLGLRTEASKRDLRRYRICRRAALDARLTRGGVGPGDYRKDCCEKITVLIKLPLCTATGLDGKGLGGHTGVAVEDEFFDYGPDVRNRRGLPATKGNLLTGTPGSQWWDDPALWDGANSPGDVGLSTVLGGVSGLAKDGDEPLDVFKIEIAVSRAEAGKVREYWADRYRSPGNYSILGSQCTSTVMDSLDRAGVWDRPLLTFKPLGFLKGLEAAVHTCGPNKGRKVRMELINRETGPLNCSKP